MSVIVEGQVTSLLSTLWNFTLKVSSGAELWASVNLHHVWRLFDDENHQSDRPRTPRRIFGTRYGSHQMPPTSRHGAKIPEAAPNLSMRANLGRQPCDSAGAGGEIRPPPGGSKATAR